MTAHGKPKCKQSVHTPGMSFRRNTCQRSAVKDGYCAQHHPDAVKAKRAQKDAEFKADFAARREAEVKQRRTLQLGEAAPDLAVALQEALRCLSPAYDEQSPVRVQAREALKKAGYLP